MIYYHTKELTSSNLRFRLGAEHQSNFFLQKPMRLRNSEATFLPSGTPVNTGVQNAPDETISSSAQTD